MSLLDAVVLFCIHAEYNVEYKGICLLLFANILFTVYSISSLAVVSEGVHYVKAPLQHREHA